MRGTARQLCKQMGIKIRPTNQRCGPMETHAINVISNLIGKHGVELMTLTLRVFTETSEGNQLELRSDAIYAVHDICRSMRRWTSLGLPFLEAWDTIEIGELRRRAKSSRLIRIDYRVRAVLCALMLDRLRPQLEPLEAKPTVVKAPPKPPRRVRRAIEIDRMIAIGRELAAMRAQFKSNNHFGRAVSARYPALDPQAAINLRRVAQAYGSKSQVYRRLSWDALDQLASRSVTGAIRAMLEQRILAGEHVTADDIRSASGKRLQSPRRRAAAVSAMRMAA
jgi:hypothetical protein